MKTKRTKPSAPRRSSIYKVWLEIEQETPDGDNVILGGPGAALRVFKSYRKAEAFCLSLEHHDELVAACLNLRRNWNRNLSAPMQRLSAALNQVGAI